MSDPELVAVFDLAGSVEAFIRAVSHIEGLVSIGKRKMGLQHQFVVGTPFNYGIFAEAHAQ